MNIDIKILNKIFVNWINQYTNRIIYANQIGFITEIKDRFHILKSINVILNSNRIKVKKILIILVDT